MKHRLLLDEVRTNEALNLAGRRIEIIGASTPEAMVQLSAVYANGSTREYYDYKEEYKSFSAEPFIDLRAKNTAQPGEWVDILVTQYDDEFKYDPRTDLTISDITGTVTIDDAAIIDAVETGAEDVADAVDAVSTILQNDTVQRAPLTTLEGASYYSCINTTTTFVTSGANVNGVIIRLASLSACGGSGRARLQIGGNDAVNIWSATDSATSVVVQDIYVPPGQAVAAISASVASSVTVLLEVL